MFLSRIFFDFVENSSGFRGLPQTSLACSNFLGPSRTSSRMPWTSSASDFFNNLSDLLALPRVFSHFDKFRRTLSDFIGVSRTSTRIPRTSSRISRTSSGIFRTSSDFFKNSLKTPRNSTYFLENIWDFLFFGNSHQMPSILLNYTEILLNSSQFLGMLCKHTGILYDLNELRSVTGKTISVCLD